MMRIRLDIETISTVTLQSSQDQIAQQEKFVSSLAGVDERVSRVEAMLQAQAYQLLANQSKQVGSSYNVSATPPRRSPPLAKNISTTSVRSEGLGVRVTPYVIVCRSGCACTCHLQQKFSSSALLNRVFGQLFVGYAGLPLISPKCNTQTCQESRASQINLEYWFPLGFFSSTIIRMQAGYQPNIGALVQLDTLRRVPDTAQCVNYALNGDIERLKYLFSQGLASPRDVSTTRGYSVLRWALYGKQYKTCEFLVHEGADPDYRPIAASDNSPRRKACHFLLEGGLSDTATSALQALTRGSHFDDFVDEARFSQIHRIVLGLSMRSLEEDIILRPEEVNAVDAMGRTPLAWAAARGNTRAVVTLLSHGADPNKIDVQLSGPVSNAAAQGHTVSVRLLLEAGAHPDPPKPDGVKKGSPLNCAARNGTDALLLKSLLDFGADVDSAGTDGKTALIQVARTDNASFATLLLEYGADINAISTSGSTPLTTAITHNSHNVLRLILDRWHEYSDCPRLKGPHLLQIAALYADLKTLNILAATDHFRLKHDEHYTIGDFGSRLRQRLDLTDELALAFNELLSIINRVLDLTEDIKSLLESGFLFHSPSRSSSGMENVDKECNSGCKDNVSCLASRLDSDVERYNEVADNDHDSDGNFEDAFDTL